MHSISEELADIARFFPRIEKPVKLYRPRPRFRSVQFRPTDAAPVLPIGDFGYRERYYGTTSKLERHDLMVEVMADHPDWDAMDMVRYVGISKQVAHFHLLFNAPTRDIWDMPVTIYTGVLGDVVVGT